MTKQMAAEPPTSVSTGNEYRILALSGGGVRGVFQAKFASLLERDTGPLAKHFDLIAATSTGALVGLALAAGVPAAEIDALYRNHAKQIFTPRRAARARRGARYTSDHLRSVLVDIFGDSRLDSLQTEVLVCAAGLERFQGRTFTRRDSTTTIVDAALASAAAPTFFPPVVPAESDRGYVDGGLWANDPVLVAVAHAVSTTQTDSHNITVLSIGTGRVTRGRAVADAASMHTLSLDTLRFLSQISGSLQEWAATHLLAKLTGAHVHTINPGLVEWVALDDYARALETLPGLAEAEYDEKGQQIVDWLTAPTSSYGDPVSPAKAINMVARAEGGLSPTRPGAVPDLVEAAIDLSESRLDFGRELRGRLSEGRVAPAKYQYAVPGGAQAWLDMCRNPEYEYHRTALRLLGQNLQEVADAVTSTADGRDVVVVSLGPGNGEKDHLVVKALRRLSTTAELTGYFPIDISEALLIAATRRVFGGGQDANGMQCTTVLGDITKLAMYSRVFSPDSAVRVFTVLGNTIGNADETDILTSLHNVMVPGDLLLAEVNVGDPSAAEEFLSGTLGQEWDLAVLVSAGYRREDVAFEYPVQTGPSEVPNTRTVVNLARIAGTNTTLQLSYVHQYDFASFREHLALRLNLDSVQTVHQEGGVALMVGRRIERPLRTLHNRVR